jgi:hypothetical protein
MTFGVAPVFLIIVFVIVIILAGFLVDELKTGRNAIVHLKPNVVGPNATDKAGTVSRTDKYVIVKPDAGGVEEVFTWDQILYVTDTAPSTKKLDRVVDLVDLVSKLGIAATVLFFIISLHQYQKGQIWEREKFLAAAVKEFDEAKTVRNARHMLDSLAQYQEGRTLPLFPSADDEKARKVFVANSQIFTALTTEPHLDLDKGDEVSIAIRECFDGFLSYLETFSHYIDQDLITKEALSAHIGYWVVLLGPNGDLRPDYKRRVFAYAEKYGLEVEALIRHYHKRFRWQQDIPLNIAFHFVDNQSP